MMTMNHQSQTISKQHHKETQLFGRRLTFHQVLLLQLTSSEFFPVPFYIILLDLNGYNSSTTKQTLHKLFEQDLAIYCHFTLKQVTNTHFFRRLLFRKETSVSHIASIVPPPLPFFHSISKPSFFLRFFFPMQFSSNNNQKTTRWDVVVETMSAKDLHGLSLIGDTGHPMPLVVAARRTVAAQTW